MSANSYLRKLSHQEALNFLLTNRIPRQWVTRVMGRLSKVENPLVVRALLAIWQQFADDLRLEEAEKQHFKSLHDCFTRRLKEGARPVDPDPQVLVSPCDAVVGAFGRVSCGELFQVKGFPYMLSDLLPGVVDMQCYEGCQYITLRLKSSMYHRLHAPCACRLEQIRYISGDTWNVNPVALKRVERLFCKNERAVLELQLPDSSLFVTLVPVAAILVASMVFHGLNEPLNLAYKGPNLLPCSAQYVKGQEMGYFEHGSTVILLASRELEWSEAVIEGATIRMGQPLMIRPMANPECHF